MAERKTFGNKVGTPRGYVDREARDKVDEAMQPVAEVGKELLWLSPLGRAAAPLRGAMAVEKAAAKTAVKKATKDAVKSSSRPARGVKRGSMRQQTLDDLKQGPKKPSTEAKDVKRGSMRQATLDSLKQGPKKPERAADVASGSARDKALKEAKAVKRRSEGSSTRKPRPGEKRFIGPMDKPKPGDKRFIGPMEKPKPGDKNFIGPKNRPAPGEKDFIGPTKPTTQRTAQRPTFGTKAKAGAAAGAGLLGYAAYRAADKPKADQGGTSSNAFAKTDRESKAAAFKAKQQGMKTSGSPTAPKKAGDKSRAAKKAPAREKPMSNFERMKKRQYEKEGFGGRSMTSRGAKERVKKERGFKFKDLFR